MVVVVATDLEGRGVVLGSNCERIGRALAREREREIGKGKNAVSLVVKMDNRVLCDIRLWPASDKERGTTFGQRQSNMLVGWTCRIEKREEREYRGDSPFWTPKQASNIIQLGPTTQCSPNRMDI